MSAPRHAAVEGFATAGGELAVGGVPLSRIAARVGRTPFYAYDRQLVTARVQALRAALPPTVRLHYAIKANPMPALLSHLGRLVDGLDVASGAELRAALDAGGDPAEISFAGPGKSHDELAQAVAAGILVNIESHREIELLHGIGERLGLTPRVAVRVNPPYELKSSGMKMGGGPKPFGIDAEEVPAALASIAARRLGFEGFHVFSGSQNLRAEAICEAQTRGLELAVQLARHAPSPVLSLNLGGGFGIPYFPGEQPLALEVVGAHLAGVASAAAEQLPQAHIVIELGRYIVGEAGIYVCRIIDRKVSRGEVFLVTDGGLHHHLAASGNFGQVIRKNYPVAIAHASSSEARETVSVVGPLCTPLDLLADRMELAAAEVGDLVVVFRSGAYGYSASPHGFLSHPPPLEVLV
ncbi:MAG TPA: pyridoxal-dependent decarboxylase, exosortase A system-associated [Caldimonas sp.]|nr:pyridoxal-dependent decarboxylase, exosortase A system-associated [Caldimonas sp.]